MDPIKIHKFRIIENVFEIKEKKINTYAQIKVAQRFSRSSTNYHTEIHKTTF